MRSRFIAASTIGVKASKSNRKLLKNSSKARDSRGSFRQTGVGGIAKGAYRFNETCESSWILHAISMTFSGLWHILGLLAGRFGLAALALALAGRFAAQRRWPTTTGTLPSDSATFGALVLGTILLVGALCFLPALALGPIGEALQH
jgi:potassium-transporting ATPase potassium-binding subunit